MKHVFIINPKAGPKNSMQNVVETLSLYKDKYDVEIFETKSTKHATIFVRNYAKSHPDEEVRFYSCGGDGTLNEVINGVAGFENASVCVYPCGSGNDFVKCIGSKCDYLDLAKLLESKNKKIDLLRINNSIYSINITNFGFDAHAAKIASNLTRKGKKNAYVKGVISSLFSAMHNRITVEVDGEILNENGRLLLGNCANGEYYGGNFKCAPNYAIDDGLIEVCMVKEVGLFTFLSFVKKYQNGLHLTDKKIQKFIKYRRAKKVRVYSQKEFDLCVDGEIISGKDFTIEILPLHINVGMIE